MGAEHTSARNVHNDVHDLLPRKGAYPDLYIRFAERNVFGVCTVVGTVPVYLDGFMGSYNVTAERTSREICVDIPDNLRTARTCVRYALRARAGADVSSELQADISVDSGGVFVRLRSRRRQLRGGIFGVPAGETAAQTEQNNRARLISTAIPRRLAGNFCFRIVQKII